MINKIKEYFNIRGILFVIVLSLPLVYFVNKDMKEQGQIREYAYAYAEACLYNTVGRTNNNPYDSIRVLVLGDDELHVASDDFGAVHIFETEEGVRRSKLSDSFTAVAYFKRDENRIYVANKYKRDTDVLAHEYIHALGIFGHETPVFVLCNLSAEQIAQKY